MSLDSDQTRGRDDWPAAPVHPLSAKLFVGIGFAFAWVCWGLCWLLKSRASSATLIESIVIAGSFGPFFAAGVCALLEGGVSGTLAFYRRAFDWRMGWPVFLLSLLLVPSLAWIAAALFERGLPSIHPSVARIPRMYLWLLVLGGPLGEEFGWSYLSDALDRRMSVIVETVLVGLVWALWHLPLFFLDIPGLSQKFVPFTAFLAMSLAMRALFAWTYHRGGRSIPSNILMHNGLNFGLSLVTVVVPVIGSSQPRLWCLSALTAFVAGLLWWRWPISKEA